MSKIEFLTFAPSLQHPSNRELHYSGYSGQMVGVIPYTSSHTSYPICLEIQLALTSQYIHNPNIFQYSHS